MKVFQEKKRQQLKKDDQDKVMRICIHQSKNIMQRKLELIIDLKQATDQ